MHSDISRSTARGGAVGSGTALQAGRSRVRFPVVSLELYIDINSSVSNRNEWQEYFLGGKCGRCGKVVLKSGSLNLLKPTRPVQACNGIASSLRIKVTRLHGVASCITDILKVYTHKIFPFQDSAAALIIDLRSSAMSRILSVSTLVRF